MSRRSDDPTGILDQTVLDERRQLTSIAYRLLGSLSDAEDAVQEAYARWYTLTDDARDAIHSPGAWLTKVTSRICLDMLGSARSRRERYVGPWIPEPLPEPPAWGKSGQLASSTVDPADRVTLDESVSMAFMVILETMTPAERVAFILHDVFHYPFADISEITGRTPGACRQLASSARRRIEAEAPAPAPTADRARVVREFKQARENMDIPALLELLDPDAIATPDGGGVVQAALEPVRGADQIARLYADFARLATDATILERSINGQPGLIAQQAGRTVSVFAFDVVGGRVTRIWAVRNPEKLQPWNGG